LAISIEFYNKSHRAPKEGGGGGGRRGNKTPGSIARGCRAVHLTTYLICELGRG